MPVWYKQQTTTTHTTLWTRPGRGGSGGGKSNKFGMGREHNHHHATTTILSRSHSHTHTHNDHSTTTTITTTNNKIEYLLDSSSALSLSLSVSTPYHHSHHSYHLMLCCCCRVLCLILSCRSVCSVHLLSLSGSGFVLFRSWCVMIPLAPNKPPSLSSSRLCSLCSIHTPHSTNPPAGLLLTVHQTKSKSTKKMNSL